MPRFSFRSAVIAVAAFGIVRAADPVLSVPPVPSLPPVVAASPTVGVRPAETAVTDSTAAAPAGVGCGACDSLCGGSGDAWVGVEWLYWGATGHRLPPLVTAIPPGGGLPGRTVVGDRTYNDDWRNGFRLTAGLWIGAWHEVGIEGDFFFLGQSQFGDAVAGDGRQILARPFLSTVRRNADGTLTPVAPFPAAQFVAIPGLLNGAVTTSVTSEFSGAGVNLVKNLSCDPCAPYRLTLGYRYLNLTDTLFVRNDLVTAAGARIVTDERFRVENHFHGVPVGLACERSAGRCFLNVRASVALGVTRSVVDIDGSTASVNAAGVGQLSTGALLALPSNIGAFTRDTFAVVPEVGVRAGVWLGCTRLSVGYNFIYWSSVVRAGGVLDTRVNASQLPNNGPVTGPLFPQRQARTTDFFAHGASIGLQWEF